MQRTATAFRIIALSTVAVFAFPIIALADCCLCFPKDAPTTNVCITDVASTCDTILTKNSVNTNLNNLDCTPLPKGKLDESSSCRTIPDGGMCAIGPIAALSYVGKADASSTTSGQSTGSGQPIVIKPPQLNIPIPGLDFGSPMSVTPGEKVTIPYLAQYISAIYSYLISIVIITAAVMIVYGGFKYVLSATAAGVQTGKDIISDAILGLVVTFTGYVILQAINPKLVIPGGVTLQTVKTVDYALVPYDAAQKIMGTTGDINWNTADCDNIEVDPKTKFPTVASAYDCAIKMAKASGIDPCYAVVKLNWESGGQTLLGCDENVAQPGVGSRVAFVQSKITYTGVTFTTTGNIDKDILNPAYKNDDSCSKHRAIDATKEDFGIDWRFSLGIGLGQVTLMPDYSYCDTSQTIQTNNPNAKNKGKGPSADFGGHCYTMKELLLPGPNLKASFYILKTQSRGNAQAGTDFDHARAAWYGYGGSGSWANRVSYGRAKDTEACAKGVAAGQDIHTFIGSDKKSQLPAAPLPFSNGKMAPW